MMNEKELQEYKTPCQYIAGVLQPCVVVISHLEANAEIERLKAEVEMLRNENIAMAAALGYINT